MSKIIVELSTENQQQLIGTLEGIVESIEQARVIKNDNTRSIAFDNIEFRITAFKENLEYMFDRTEMIHIEK